VQSEETWIELQGLHRHGWTKSALAREFGLKRRTVARYAAAENVPRYPERARPTTVPAAQLAHVERRLTAFGRFRGTDLFTKLVDRYGFRGSYASFQRQVRSAPGCRERAGDPLRDRPWQADQVDWAILGPCGLATSSSESTR